MWCHSCLTKMIDSLQRQEDEKYHHATRVLLEIHQEEQDEMASNYRDEINELKDQIFDQTVTIANLNQSYADMTARFQEADVDIKMLENQRTALEDEIDMWRRRYEEAADK